MRKLTRLIMNGFNTKPSACYTLERYAYLRIVVKMDNAICNACLSY